MNKYKKIIGIGLTLVVIFVFAGAMMAFSQASAITKENDVETESISQPLFELAG